MAMGMDGPRKCCSSDVVPQCATAVKRSSSVPVDLADDAEAFMKSLRMEQTSTTTKNSSNSSSIPEDQAISPLRLDDSIRTDEDFFLSMDEEKSGTKVRTRRPLVSKVVEQQQQRQAALAKLEAFFLGESTGSSAVETSPVSVADIMPRRIASTKLALPIGATSAASKRNIFGHILQDAAPLQVVKQKVQHQRTQSVDHGLFLEDETDEDVHFMFTAEASPAVGTFKKLNASDRAQSLPLEYMTYRSNSISSNTKSCNVTQSHSLLTKKPSLKKISSFGHGLSRKDSSSGSLLRAVSFSSLSIREYPPAISDHPSCSFGPPVQLDWDYEAEETHPIDQYEEFRQPRRRSHDLLLSYYDRRYLLIKQAGYTHREVKQAMKEAERVKRERMVTDLFLPAQALDETMETVVNTVKRFFTKK